jgi:Uma2 family endonuclease
LQSGSAEVWLVFPENNCIIVVTKNQRLVFATGEVVRNQNVLLGFNVAVNELLV